MGASCDGIESLLAKLESKEQLIGIGIDYALEATGKECADDAKLQSPVDTWTLFNSWEVREDNKETGSFGEDGIHSVTVWSNPSIIATNPKHPDGEYYSDKIENGFVKPDGKYYRGRHMLKKAFSKCKRNLKANLKKELGDILR